MFRKLYCNAIHTISHACSTQVSMADPFIEGNNYLPTEVEMKDLFETGCECFKPVNKSNRKKIRILARTCMPSLVLFLTKSTPFFCGIVIVHHTTTNVYVCGCTCALYLLQRERIGYRFQQFTYLPRPHVRLYKTK